MLNQESTQSATTGATSEQEAVLAAVKVCPPFRELDPHTQQALARILKLRQFAAREKLWDAFAPAETMYLVVEGEVHFASRDREGDPFPYPEVRYPGDIFGEVGFFTLPPKRTASAVAISKTTALEIHRDQFPALLTAFPGFTDYLYREMAERLRRNDELIRTRASGNWSATPKADRVLRFFTHPAFLIGNVVFLVGWWVTRWGGADESLANLGVFAAIEAFVVSGLVLARQLAAGEAAQQDLDEHHRDSVVVRRELEAIRRALSESPPVVTGPNEENATP